MGNREGSYASAIFKITIFGLKGVKSFGYLLVFINGAILLLLVWLLKVFLHHSFIVSNLLYLTDGSK